MTKEKKETYLKGAMFLGAAGILVKIMGALFRIPLGRAIGSEGMGYYQVGYTVYNFMLAFTYAGFPTAISKLVSAKKARGEHTAAHDTFLTALKMLSFLGLAGSLALGFGAGFLANYVFESPLAYHSILALAPTVLFISILAAFRGYFQGMKDMKPTALSQVVEQFGRVLVGLALAFTMLRLSGEPLAAAGGVFGAGAGGLAAMIMIIFLYRKRKMAGKMVTSDSLGLPPETTGKMMKDIVAIAFPIAIGAAVMPLINMVDTLVVLRRLQESGFTYAQANSLYGQLQGMAATLVNLPQVITIALAMSIVPAVSDAAARKDWEAVQTDSASVFRVSLMMGLPASAGLVVLAHPIMQFIYPGEPASLGEIMFIMGFAVFFLTQLQTLTGILQGLGKPHIPVRNLMIGAGCKLFLTYFLTATFLHVRGAAIGTVVAYIIAFSLNLWAVKKLTGVRFDMKQVFLKPFISVMVMAVLAWGSHRILLPMLGNSLAVVLAISIGAATYGLMLLKTDALEMRDFDLLPKGDKIAQLLKKLKLLRP
ncbi:putative polysaccharide biosynthesis protein [Tindallia californiensis]|uniref:Stage V sporulation protein B n=1 Tax=Tindallia californiensis TaxID=159292 RepID=A0A1H3PGX2_9FIRM|nr:polysaccharide biosynthesis protein [Tindallia californiensis]SDZ00065.1 stage V sporulation protein B [Tindallia californiensis]